MKCPHCQIEIHEGFSNEWIRGGAIIGTEDEEQTQWQTHSMTCPACGKAILALQKYWGNSPQDATLIYPKVAVRPKAATEVPKVLADDYNEACLVLGDSPKASAALSRRCVQQILRLQGFTQHDLAKAIDAVLASKTLPASLAANLDAVRNIGNFAAHPIKDTNSGQIVEVEPEEAEWNLDVLEGLFDYYYVGPARDAARIAALNAKLAAAGKPAIKK